MYFFSDGRKKLNPDRSIARSDYREAPQADLTSPHLASPVLTCFGVAGEVSTFRGGEEEQGEEEEEEGDDGATTASKFFDRPRDDYSDRCSGGGGGRGNAFDQDILDLQL